MIDDKVRALAAGTAASAARQGLPVTVCPYSAQSTPRERELARVWVAAYSAARPPVDVSFDDEDADDEEGDAFRARDGHELREYWTRGPGLAKWSGSPKPWTTLYKHLLKYMPAGKAKRTAAQWFHDVKGYWPGHQKGSNPTGPG